MIVNRAIPYLLFAFTFLMANESWSQNQNTKLANEYFNKRDYEKSYGYYKKLIKNDTERKYIYANYITSLRKLEEQKDGIKMLSKLIDEDGFVLEYQIDRAVLEKDLGNETTFNQEIKTLIDANKKNRIQVLKLSNLLALRKLNAEAIQLLLDARSSEKNPFAYAQELTVLYKNTNQKNLMVDELLNILETGYSQITEVENELQMLYSTKTEYDQLADKVFLRLNTNNEKLQFNELLVWIYMQHKDFYNAFVQLRSIDKKIPQKRGSELIDLGDVAIQNQDYKNGILIYDYVTKTYPQEYHYEKTKKKLIGAKEEQSKNTYPIDTLGIKSVLADYDRLKKQSKNIRVNAEINLSEAELYAFYLQETAPAKKLLAEVIENLRVSTKTQAKAKLLLGDIYLIEGKTGDAMLEYMQVERMIEDDDLGHLAKLKTAKVSYFEAEFDLALAHLDILKRATTRKIANDAQDLSLLIKGNLALDTTAEAMTAFANVELMILQKRYQEALDSLESINKKFPKHSLTDEIHYQRAQIFQQINKFDEAIAELKKVLEEHESVLADDAMIEIARLYHYNLKNAKEAKEYYKKIMLEFPGSIYVAEARKAYYNQ